VVARDKRWFFAGTPFLSRLQGCLACEAETVGTLKCCLACDVATVETCGAMSKRFMDKLFAPNLQSEGRRARGALAFMFGALALGVIPFSRRLSMLLFFAAIFTAFEAVRGWCAFRACGIRTQV
jgi:hypothetical protein